jgi:hypothetical protein
LTAIDLPTRNDRLRFRGPMLCSRCDELVIQDPRTIWDVTHHLSYTALRKSSEHGCRLCDFLRQALLVKCAHQLKCSRRQAEIHHLNADKLQSDAHKSQGHFLARNVLLSTDYILEGVSANFLFFRQWAGLSRLRHCGEKLECVIGVPGRLVCRHRCVGC